MQTVKTLPKRSEVNASNTWKIEDIYPSDQDWKKELESILKQNYLEKFQGILAHSAKNLLDALTVYHETSCVIDKLYVYATMKFHEDSTNSFYQTMSNQAELLLIGYSAKTSFLIPEIVEIPEKKLQQFQKEEKGLELYAHLLENITRQKKHTLSQKEEELLAKTAELANAPQTIFTMLNDADMRFPNIKDENGEEVELTKGRYTTFLENQNRQVRKQAFETLYDTYLKQKNTLAASYYASVKGDAFYANVRNYDSALQAALEDDKIPVSVYDTLLETVHESLPLLHRYVALRKKMLGVDELHMYDLYVPVVKQVQKEISYEEAKQTVQKALSVMGNDYVQALQKGFDGGWIDVYENEGKRSGAYSWGTYSAHPYVLLNHNNTINSMFTVAHEMGHALHSYFTWQKQPYVYGGHKIFVAEVASTCNEALLMEYLLKHTDEKEMKKYLINYFMEQFRGTFFRQAMFAEFEKITHEMVERGEPLTCENLSKIYHDLNCLYYGNDIVIDEKIDIEWARIPHFYNAFYVYQYATGYCAAIALSRQILSEGAPAVKRYLEFLSKGDSEYSIDLLKGAGVDMTQKQPLQQAMKVFEELLNELERL